MAIPFRSMSRNRLVAALFRHDWARVSSTSLFASTARHSQCVLPLIRLTTLSRGHLSTGAGRSRRILATIPWSKRFTPFRQKILHVAQAQSKSVVGSDGVSDDTLRRPYAFDPRQIFEVQHAVELPRRSYVSNLTKPSRRICQGCCHPASTWREHCHLGGQLNAAFVCANGRGRSLKIRD